MLTKYILLSILLISSVFISGCVFENNNKPNQTIGPDFIPRTDLPAGFTYMGIHETTINIANSTMSGFEGVYRYGGDDIYITAVKNDDPEALLSQYKADLKKPFKADYNPFEEITINGHSTTKFTGSRIENGKTVLRYSLIWANNGYLIQVGSFADVNPVVVLASATGY